MIIFQINKHKKGLFARTITTPNEAETTSANALSSKLIRAKHLFLTYSQVPSDWTREFVLESLKAKIEIKSYIVSLEHHKDEGIHFHVTLSLEKQPNVPMRFFDILDPTTKEPYHPKVDVADLITNVLYCVKEDTAYLIFGYDLASLRRKKDKQRSTAIIQETVKAFEKEGYNGAIAYFLAKASVTQKTLYSSKVKTTLKALREMRNRLEEPRARFHINDFFKVGLLEQFLSIYTKDSSIGAVFIGGLTGIGKTEFIEALLTSRDDRWLTVSTLEELHKYDLHLYDFIIFDDVDLSRFDTPESFLRLFDHRKASSIPCRWSNPIIPKGVGRIFVSNVSFYGTLLRASLQDHEELIRRVLDLVLIHYLSPKVPRYKKNRALEIGQQLVIKVDARGNKGNITLNTAQLRPREQEVPVFNSFDHNITCIPSFLNKAVPLSDPLDDSIVTK